MALEYISHGFYSMKLDVFSFGILVLEIAWTNWSQGTASNLINQPLGNGSRNEITRCILIGLLRVQENVAYRPIMASIVQMLNSDSSSLPTPARPAFLIYSDIEQDLPLLVYFRGF
uniref:Serine-threonine/tyrosine-protein kinase catalytic domain-containing protein n=1 Tax=Quercus lobata TaxID=97700 RepID=A0A7N2LYE2_QUELO